MSKPTQIACLQVAFLCAACAHPSGGTPSTSSSTARHGAESSGATASASVSASASKATVGAPSSLPICKGDSKDPLAPLCKLGANASDAFFECTAPQPMAFCGKQDNWGCTHSVFAKSPAPSIVYFARFDHAGPPIKEGDEIDAAKMQRTGPIREVEAQFAAPTAAEGATIGGDVASKILSWGCVQKIADGDRKVFDCGAWEISVEYSHIINVVEVSAAMNGGLRCE